MSVTLIIKQTWDAQAISKEEWTQIQLSFRDNGDLNLSISAPFYDDPAPSGEKGSFWELWEYEVVELFLVGDNGQYTELEFSPHGHYLTLRLDAPRSVIAKEETIEYRANIEGSAWTGHSIVPHQLLPSSIQRINAFAIHGCGEHRRYLCYHPLPHDKPDFHQPDRFPLYSLIKEADR